MAVRNRTESLTWGLLILLLGVLLQLHYLKPELHILENLWRFWPVLIIIMGINKLVRYFSAKGAEGAEPPK
jgi:cell wall-active antibiotic response 4TMS protein YvqF